MCTININTLEMDRQVFCQTNYLQSSKVNYAIESRSNLDPTFLDKVPIFSY